MTVSDSITSRHVGGEGNLIVLESNGIIPRAKRGRDVIMHDTPYSLA